MKDQPTLTPFPIVRPVAEPGLQVVQNEEEDTSFICTEATRTKHKFTTRQGWLGNYDYAWYMSPT